MDNMFTYPVYMMLILVITNMVDYLDLCIRIQHTAQAMRVAINLFNFYVSTA